MVFTKIGLKDNLSMITEEEISKIIIYARFSGILQEKIVNEKNKNDIYQYRIHLIKFGNYIFDILINHKYDLSKVLDEINKFEWEPFEEIKKNHNDLN